jgi:hypothetical protein
MELKTRRLLYYAFLLLFFIITPLVSLYASGYKLGNGFKVQKTGILILNTNPPGARIYLDNQAQKSFFKSFFSPDKSFITTPAKIKDILPGGYTIKLELDNYWPWQKKLEIKSGESTYAENISLFRDTLPLELISDRIDNLLLSPDKKKVLLVNQDKVIAYNLEKENIILEKNVRAASSTQNLWLPNNDYIIDSTLYSQSENQAIIDFNATLGKGINSLKTNGFDSNLIYYRVDSTILSYNLATKENKTLLSDKNASDFLPQKDNLFYIEKYQNSTDLIMLNLESGNSQKTSLPNSNYTFIHPEHDLVNLFDQDQKILYLLDPLSSIKPLKETIYNVNKSEWINSDKLLFANDFEIWTLNLSSGEKVLLTRLSDKIQKIIWHPNDNYVAYATDKTLNIIELDKRDRYNSTKLLELEDLKFPFLNEKGDTAYFYARIGKRDGLYKLLIQ